VLTQGQWCRVVLPSGHLCRWGGLCLRDVEGSGLEVVAVAQGRDVGRTVWNTGCWLDW
jgi:hypothetical protein